MAQDFAISGMHCGGCVNRVAKALRTIDAGVEVTLDPPRAQFSDAAQVSPEAINAVLSKIGDYRVSDPA